MMATKNIYAKYTTAVATRSHTLLAKNFNLRWLVIALFH